MPREAQWVTVLVEPFASEPARAAAVRSLEAWREDDYPQWSFFFAGLLSTLAKTLPSNDPWVSLESRGDTFVNSWTGREFGSWRDGTDIVSLQVAESDVAVDPGLCALAEGLPACGADLFFSASKGLTATQGRIDGLPVENAGTVVLRVLAWLLWRRRAFVGGFDDAVATLVPGWAERAERWVETGVVPSEEAVAFEVDAYRIESSEYDLLRRVVGD